MDSQNEKASGNVNAVPVVKPTVGRIVYYKISAQDAEEINRRRDDFNANKAETKLENWQKGAQAHVGNAVSEGQIYAMIIVAVWSDECINGKVFLDGNDDFWALSRNKGEGNGNWDWMPFQKDQQARLGWAGQDGSQHKHLCGQGETSEQKPIE